MPLSEWKIPTIDELCDEVRACMDTFGISGRTLGEKACGDRTFVSRLLSGKTKDPSLERVRQLALFLQTYDPSMD